MIVSWTMGFGSQGALFERRRVEATCLLSSQQAQGMLWSGLGEGFIIAAATIGLVMGVALAEAHWRR